MIFNVFGAQICLMVTVVCFAALSDNFLNLKEKKPTHSYVYSFLKISNYKKKPYE